MTVFNVGFHKALEIPWPDPPLSAFNALCSTDFDITHYIWRYARNKPQKNHHAAKFFMKWLIRDDKSDAWGNVNETVRSASMRTLSLCILWIMWATNILGKRYLRGLLVKRTLLIWESNANIKRRDSVIETFHKL
jgi:hypothetical protein